MDPYDERWDESGWQVDFELPAQSIGPVLRPRGLQYTRATNQQAVNQEAPYQQAAHEQAAYGQVINQQVPYQQGLYEQAPYQQTPHPQAPYQQASYERNIYQQAAQQRTPYQQDSYWQSAYQQGAYRQTMYQQGAYQEEIADMKLAETQQEIAKWRKLRADLEERKQRASNDHKNTEKDTYQPAAYPAYQQANSQQGTNVLHHKSGVADLRNNSRYQVDSALPAQSIGAVVQPQGPQSQQATYYQAPQPTTEIPYLLVPRVVIVEGPSAIVNRSYLEGVVFQGFSYVLKGVSK
ncbi:hypothetical protein HD806DRAFT_496351 [Xylariaceae sp. AK1471]|nr:hypothetical protein HD806DRAFT_496351 [Xylariaceae sp. AK1471]